ncbi:MAG: zinc ribbon domain-containing protein, partial [Candidatus Thermoplasmatota archaeon]|nr:zinc ribbon domain-containing protein [Candidatus Thermoplasmatota archaeon]
IGGRDGILSSYNVMGNLIWQYKTGSVKATAKKLVTKGVTTTQINETGQHIAVGSVNKNAYFLSRNQELLYKFEGDDEITGLAMSKVGATMAIVAGNTIHLIENVGLYPLLFDQMSQKIKEAHNHRIDVSKPMERYRSSQDEYKKGNYEKASAYLISVIKQIDIQQNVGIKELLSKVTFNMAKAEVADKDLTSVKEMLARAKEIYKKGNFYRAVASFHNVIDRLESMNREETPPPKEVPPPERTPSSVPRMKPEAPKQKEVPLPAPRDRVVTKREVVPPPLQKERVANRPSAAEILKRDNLMREVMVMLENFERRITSLHGDGMNVNSLEEVAKEARIVFNNGEYQKAADFIKLGEKEAALFLKRGEKKKALDLLSNITVKMTNANSKGIDITECELIMAKGVKAFENDMFAESIAIIEKLGADIERMIQRSSPRYGNVRQLIKQVSDEIKLLKNAGMNTIDLEDMIDDCWVHLDSDIPFVESLVKEANEKINLLKDQHEGIMEEFRESLSRIEALEHKGYNTTKVQGTYQDALIVLYSGNLKKALEHLDQLRDELDELEQEGGSDEGLSVKVKALSDSLKERIAHLQDEIIMKNEELSKKEHQISEFYITIREMEERMAEMEKKAEALKDCPSCSHPSSTGSKFCGECGFRFEMNCPSCDTIIPEGFLFCGKCGTKIE